MEGNIITTMVRYDNHIDGLNIHELGFIRLNSDVPFMEDLKQFCKEHNIDMDIMMIHRNVFADEIKLFDKDIWDVYTLEEFENRVNKCH